jgi:hypothetical protein
VGITSLLSGQQQMSGQVNQLSGQMDGISQMLQSTLGGVTDLQKTVGQIQGAQGAMSDLLGRLDGRVTNVELKVNSIDLGALQPQLQLQTQVIATPVPQEIRLLNGMTIRPGERINELGQLIDAQGFLVQR